MACSSRFHHNRSPSRGRERTFAAVTLQPTETLSEFSVAKAAASGVRLRRPLAKGAVLAARATTTHQLLLQRHLSNGSPGPRWLPSPERSPCIPPTLGPRDPPSPPSRTPFVVSTLGAALKPAAPATRVGGVSGRVSVGVSDPPPRGFDQPQNGIKRSRQNARVRGGCADPSVPNARVRGGRGPEGVGLASDPSDGQPGVTPLDYLSQRVTRAQWRDPQAPVVSSGKVGRASFETADARRVPESFPFLRL
jgi:hypothetical protein